MTLRLLAPVLGLVCALSGGCATELASEAPLKPATPTIGEESANRVSARIHTELATAYYQVAGNDPTRMGIALEEANQALKHDPNYGPAYNVAGLVYAALKQDSHAEESFRRALAINPMDSLANNNYGLFLCERGREEEGIRYFMAAVHNPLYATPDRAYVNAGICARRAGHTASAQDYFRQALQVRPNQPQALYNLAELGYEGHDYRAAKNRMDVLMRVAKPNAAALWLALRIERKLGDSASAASYAQQLRKNFPDSKEARALGAGQFE